MCVCVDVQCGGIGADHVDGLLHGLTPAGLREIGWRAAPWFVVPACSLPALRVRARECGRRAPSAARA
eukprot:15229936-Alexandrium_andersonii.AAC.1